MPHPAARLAATHRAVASLEFGILAPVMALFVIGVFDLSKVAILQEQIWNAARGIAESASTMSLPGAVDQPNILTWNQANLALSVTLADIPWVRAGIATGAASGSSPIYAVLTSVDYTYAGPASACTTTCSGSYAATVKWSKAYVYPGFNAGAGVLRSCGAPLAQNGIGQDSATGVLAGLTLAQGGITVPDPFLVADVTLSYTPFFFNFITGPVRLSASSYVPVRTDQPGATQQWVQFDDTNDPNPAAQCSVAVSG